MEKLKEQWELAPLWQRALLLLTFSLIIAYGVYISLISPIEEQASQYEQEKQQLESELNIIKSFADKNKAKLLELKLKNLENNLNQNKLKLETLKSFMPSDLEINQLFDVVIANSKSLNLKLQRLGVEKEEDVLLYYDKQSNKVEIETLSKEDKKDKGKQKQSENKDNKQNENKEGIKAKKVYLRSSVSGNTENIIKFLESFSKAERLIIVDKVEFSKQQQLLTADITLTTYYIPQQEEKNENKK